MIPLRGEFRRGGGTEFGCPLVHIKRAACFVGLLQRASMSEQSPSFGFVQCRPMLFLHAPQEHFDLVFDLRNFPVVLAKVAQRTLPLHQLLFGRFALRRLASDGVQVRDHGLKL
jgi:hypothetical protein